MDYRRWNRLRLGLLLGNIALSGGVLLAAPQAYAALGGDHASIAADQAYLKASLKLTSRPLYEVHELQLPTGTTVREYAAPDGAVFAIAWNGPAMPDLQQTLGTYFADYVEAARTSQQGHNHLAAVRADLVVQSTGHMRAFVGRAYLASAVPAGVSIDELR
ncbi:MAG: DUF2844 domain-containing protein [Steroidobacterales bacterium]